MRLLHVVPAVAERYGGPSAALRGMTRALALRGMDVTVVTTNADGPAVLDVPVNVPLCEDGVTYRYFPRSLPGEWKFSWSLTRWLAANIADFDVVTVHGLFSYPTIPACRTAYHRAIPYVLRPLGTLGDWSLRQRRWKKAPYLALIERTHLRHASAIHVTSHDERSSIETLGFGAKARVIPLGVDTPAAGTRTPRDGFEPFRLLYLSRLHEGKNLPILFSAIRGARERGVNVELTVAGNGEPRYTAFLHERARKLGVSERIRFVGHLSGAAKADVFARADAFVLPSAHENFGIAVVEALAAGLPVIISPQVGVAAEVSWAGAGIVASIDDQAIGDAIGRLSGDPIELARMGEAASQLARRQFSWSACAEELIDLYRALARAPLRAAQPSNA